MQIDLGASPVEHCGAYFWVSMQTSTPISLLYLSGLSFSPIPFLHLNAFVWNLCKKLRWPGGLLSKDKQVSKWKQGAGDENAGRKKGKFDILLAFMGRLLWGGGAWYAPAWQNTLMLPYFGQVGGGKAVCVHLVLHVPAQFNLDIVSELPTRRLYT